MNKHLIILLFLLIALCTNSALAQQTSPGSHADHEELKFILILTRHGIRSPTWNNDRLDQYSKQPWPRWDVPAGYLTPHGKKLMTLFGAYDREYLVHQGLLKATGCADVAKVYLWADTDERTLETGHGLADGMFPGCNLPLHALAAGVNDPLFHPADARRKADRALASAALAGRIGNNPAALQPAYQPALNAMQQALFDCSDPAACSIEGKQRLLDIPAAIEAAKNDHLADLRSPLGTASTFAENFFLEYVDGLPLSEVGWGRVDEPKLRQFMMLHTAYSDLLQRTPYIAKVQASDLLSHILRTLEQATAGTVVPGALGSPENKLVVLIGHDSNIASVAGLLGLSWLLEGYQRDDAAPGGALVFELWRKPGNSEDVVRTYYMAQSLEQMRNTIPLTLNTPPQKAAVFVPGCSTSGEGAPCNWNAFHRTVQNAINPAFVR